MSKKCALKELQTVFNEKGIRNDYDDVNFLLYVYSNKYEAGDGVLTLKFNKKGDLLERENEKQ